MTPCQHPACLRPCRARYCERHSAPAECFVRAVWSRLEGRMTLRELRTLTGFSTSTIRRAVMELERRGVLAWTPRTARALVVREPWAWCEL